MAASFLVVSHNPDWELEKTATQKPQPAPTAKAPREACSFEPKDQEWGSLARQKLSTRNSSEAAAHLCHPTNATLQRGNRQPRRAPGVCPQLQTITRDDMGSQNVGLNLTPSRLHWPHCLHSFPGWYSLGSNFRVRPRRHNPWWCRPKY